MYKRIPFVRIIAGLVWGIFLDGSCRPDTISWFCSIVFLCMFSWSLGASSLSIKWKYGWVFGLCMMGILTCIGGISNAWKSNSRKPAQLIAGPCLLFKITEGPKKSTSSRRYLAACYQLDSNNITSKGNSYIYLTKADISPINLGDLLLTEKVPEAIIKNANPGAFDFATYSMRNGIRNSIFLDAQEFVNIPSSSDVFTKTMQNIRQKILSIVRQHVQDNRNAGLAEAMLIGYREDLDKELLTAYTNTGVVHIIAISGLHLGLIFMLIDLLVKTLAGKKRAAVAGLLISLPLLWAFAILTGSSASVIRSAIMFSFIIVGNAMGKKNNSMNSLLGSAVMLLAWNPDIFFDIGFELSYAAVTSILLFDQQIKKSIYLKNKMAAYLWGMVSITLAAQVLTTPLVISHFHRFPTLFLFTNLVAVPLSSMVLLMEILLCLVHPLEQLANLLGAGINGLIELMNGFVVLMGKIPMGSIDDIRISDAMMVFIVLFLTFCYGLLKYPQQTGYWAFAVGMLSIPVCHIAERLWINKSRDIHILNVYGSTAIVHRHGHQGIFVASASFYKNKPKTKELLSQTGIALGITNWKIKLFPDLPAIIRINAAMTGQQWVLLSKATPVMLSDLLNGTLAANGIIADASTPLWKIKQWEKESQKLHLRFYSTPQRGPFRVHCPKNE